MSSPGGASARSQGRQPLDHATRPTFTCTTHRPAATAGKAGGCGGTNHGYEGFCDLDIIQGLTPLATSDRPLPGAEEGPSSILSAPDRGLTHPPRLFRDTH